MKFNIITIFPDQLMQTLQFGVIGRAIENRTIELNFIDPREFSDNDYGSIDDKAYGGGPGMVMQVEPILSSIEKIKKESKNNIQTVFLTPQGEQYTQKQAELFMKYNEIIIVSGRYEGFDERLLDLTENAVEISIGDYVLSGGEIAASVIIDSITRLIPGVLGDDQSAVEESFTSGLLDHPHYTRPEIVRNKEVPNVLLSGNHKAIKRWRLKQSIMKTFKKRPDLLKKRKLSKEEQLLLDEYLDELDE
ncbi:MAG TPA: tRNA (guanosine(37)-N1)-methyltransferase TrmD [Gammaproteobacteria bacterium]|jgi:tRNA (guanine37-N1)-methyltransferase|nr:tRNA (guanosine(37)-N1)-methyltransferase TrmD [Gammaproteobacteria bacterium]HIK76863.1 tRNA (guanosine(37)-N1)-methyltransferase TrmD [Gammaproteobacteria bacterium]